MGIHYSIVLECSSTGAILSAAPQVSVGATLALLLTFCLWPHNTALKLTHFFPLPLYLITRKSCGKYVVTLLNVAVYYLYLLSVRSVACF